MDMNVICIPFLSSDDRACLRNGAVNPGSPVPTYVAKRDNSRHGKNSALVRSAIVLQSAGSFCSVNLRCRTSCSPSFLLKCECVRERECVRACMNAPGHWDKVISPAATMTPGLCISLACLGRTYISLLSRNPSISLLPYILLLYFLNTFPLT